MKTSDKILTFSALFISCLALAVSIIQTNILQKQSQAAVWPRIEVLNSYGKDYYTLSVVNQGVGPAIISDIEYVYEDTSRHRIIALMKYLLSEDLKKQNLDKSPPLNIGYSEILKGRVIKPAESIEIYSAKDSVSVQLAHDYFEKVNIKISYCSIYETCWRLDNDVVIELD